MIKVNFMTRQYTRRNIFIGLIISVTFLFLFIWYSYSNMKTAVLESNKVNNSLHSLRTLEDLMDDMQDLETGKRGYLLTGNKEFLEPYYSAIKRLPKDTAAVSTLSLLYPDRQNSLQQLLKLANRKVQLTSILPATNGFDSAYKKIQISQGKQVMDSIRSILSSFENEDRIVLQKSNVKRQAAAKATAKFFITLSALLLLAVAIIFWRFHNWLNRREAYEKRISYLAELTEKTSDAIFSTDASLIIKSWNNAAKEMYGYTEEEAIGKGVAALLKIKGTEEDFVVDLANLNRLGFARSEYQGEKKNGKTIFIQASVSVLKNEKNKIEGYVGVHRDVSERKKAEELSEKYNKELARQAEENLKKREIQLLASIENTPNVAVQWYNKRGEVIFWNKASEKMFGWKSSEAIGKTVDKLILSFEGTADFIKTLQQIEETNMSVGPAEFTLHHKDGTGINTISTIFSIPSIEGEPCFVCMDVDITESKKAAAFLKESEEKYRSMFEQASDGIFIMDDEGRYVDVNPAACSLVGYSRDEILKMSTVDILPTGHVPMRELKPEELRLGERLMMERQLRNKKGEIFDSEISYKMLSTGYTLAIVRDITERKEAAEKIIKEKTLSNTIINSLPGVFYVFDGDKKLLRWNTNFETVSGYSVKELLEIEPGNFFAEEDRELASQKLEEILQNGAAEMEANFLTKSGKKIPYVFTGLAINYEGKHCLLGTGIDISQLKKSQQDYSQLVNSVEGIVWEADAKTFEFSFVSKQAEKLLGYPVENWINDPSFWVNHIVPEDKDFAVDYCIASTREKKNHVFEYRMVAANGKIVWLRDVVVVVIENNEPVRLYGIMIDITDIKQAEEEILKSNARFQLVSKATSDIVWDWDLSSGEIWWNDNYYKSLGYRKTKEVLLISDWYNHIHPDDVSRVRDKIKKIIDNPSVNVWRAEYRYVKADNEFLNLLDRGFVIRDKEGKATRMIGSMVDMTPIYAVQKKIEESENRLRTILDTDPECIKLLDENCNLLDINIAGLEMVQADTMQELLGKTLLPVVADEQKEEMTMLVKNAFKGESGRIEFGMIGLKGIRRRCEMVIVPFKNAEGLIVSALGVTRDITENKKIETNLKLSEEKYRTVIEQAIDAIALYDADGNVLDINTGCLKLLGYSKEELMKLSLADILTPEEIEHHPIEYKTLEKGDSTVKQRKLKRKDGTVVETEVRSQQLPDGRFLSVVRDLTERIETEKELAASYEAIRKLIGHVQNVREEERTSIAREIHDELGQQLTVMKMDVSWLKKKVGTSDESVKEKMSELITMLNDTVKKVRRISSELRPSLLDDLGLVAAMEWQMGEFEKKIGISTHFIHNGDDLHLPDSIKTTLYRISQESLTNVARHSQATAVTVVIKQKNDNLVLSVSDNGRGFDKEKIAAKKTLGILGMKERIAMVGGIFEIKSGIGKGTEIFVQIPLNTNKPVLK